MSDVEEQPPPVLTDLSSPSSLSSSSSPSFLTHLKIPPHSIEAEQALIGGIMLDNHAWEKVVETVSENDFYKPEHRVLFRSIFKLASRNSPLDVLTLSEVLKETRDLDKAGGEVYLYELAKNTPSASNIHAYANIVRERSVLRQLLTCANEIADSAFNPTGRQSIDLLDEAERRIFSIAEQNVRGNRPRSIKELLTQAMERIDRLYHSDCHITGLATGFTDLDELTSGLQQGDLVIIAGRPSMGKTAFSLNIAEHAAIKNPKPVLYFSMEMPGDSLAMRMMSSLGLVEQNRVRSGKLHDDDWPRITSALGMLSEAKFFIDDTPALTPAEVRARARRVAKEHGELGLIVIDYLQLMRGQSTSENRATEISEISRSLKALAKELNVPLIALSQLNRGLEQRTDKRPMMSDLRESGAIEQDADVIIFIYRDEVYNPETPDKGAAEIIIGKQRNGPIGRLKLTFRGQFTRFDNFADNRYQGKS
jgi:replicative DNA helicase